MATDTEARGLLPRTPIRSPAHTAYAPRFIPLAAATHHVTPLQSTVRLHLRLPTAEQILSPSPIPEQHRGWIALFGILVTALREQEQQSLILTQQPELTAYALRPTVYAAIIPAAA